MMEQKVVLITGGSRGIGAATARRFAAGGCKVVINYHRSQAQAEALAAEIGGWAVQADVADPVELLMKVQLGGGTNIASAVEYGRQLIEQPAKSVIILVSDFYEGGSSSLLTHQVKKCVQSGIKVLGLAALDSTATPCYDRDTAQALVNVGAQIAAMTPGELASWLAENLQS